jgi:hypothetical protein
MTVHTQTAIVGNPANHKTTIGESPLLRRGDGGEVMQNPPSEAMSLRGEADE